MVEPGSARTMLDLGDSGPLWGRLDADWYRRARPETAGLDADALRRFYLLHGQALGHTPNPLFSEAWSRDRYPGTLAGCASMFDAFCRGGWRDRSPHWLFDPAYFTAQIGTGTGGRYGPYDQFLSQDQVGPSRLFDPAMQSYRAFVARLPGDGPEPRTSMLFDPEWYLERYPEIGDGVARGVWHSALHHYMTNETPAAFDPLPQFSEAFYLGRNPDVAQAVQSGTRRNGYAHFLENGAAEERAPRSDIDLVYYRASNPDVGADIAAGRHPDAFTHYLAHGATRAANASAPGEMPAEHLAKALWRAQADAMLPLHARRVLDFTCAGSPALSVIMVLHDQFALTMRTLASLRATYAGAIELILVDSGSADETRFIGRYVSGARLLRLDVNVGFVRAGNAGLYSVTAPYVLFLNTDVELAPGAIDNALTRAGGDPRIGAVGGKIIRAHGKLQEAGCIVWRDGVTEGYMRDASPLAPEANFVRDVDFCSGAFLLVRAGLLNELDGFDESYAPAYYEDADLCLRIAARGYRVVYDPSVVIHHLEYGSAEGLAEPQTRMSDARAVFAERHPQVRARAQPTAAARVLARSSGPSRTRILMIEDMAPLRRLGSGFVRSNDILCEMAAIGHAVTVLPMIPSAIDLAAVYADMPDSVEVMHDQSEATFPGFLDSRPGAFDIVWIARTHNLDRALPALTRWIAACPRRPRLILDTEAVAATRSAVHATLEGREFDLDAALAAEFRNARACDAVIAVSQADASTLRAIGLQPCVLGHMRRVALTPAPFGERAGILFVGAMHTADSPNFDALRWFIDEVLPLIEAALGWETRLTVIGHLGGAVKLQAFDYHPRVTLLGPVGDTRAAYDSHRVFIAPTRFAGGTPYKVHEAASFGLPVIATQLIADQLGWCDELLVADSPEDFARAVLLAYRDERVWSDLRARAAGRVERENAPDDYSQNLGGILACGEPSTSPEEQGQASVASYSWTASPSNSAPQLRNILA